MRRTNTISISAGASYSAPAVSVLEVEAEGLLCSSSGRADVGYDNENDLGEI